MIIIIGHIYKLKICIITFFISNSRDIFILVSGQNGPGHYGPNFGNICPHGPGQNWPSKKDSCSVIFNPHYKRGPFWSMPPKLEPLWPGPLWLGPFLPTCMFFILQLLFWISQITVYLVNMHIRIEVYIYSIACFGQRQQHKEIHVIFSFEL